MQVRAEDACADREEQDRANARVSCFTARDRYGAPDDAGRLQADRMARIDPWVRADSSTAQAPQFVSSRRIVCKRFHCAFSLRFSTALLTVCWLQNQAVLSIFCRGRRYGAEIHAADGCLGARDRRSRQDHDCVGCTPCLGGRASIRSGSGAGTSSGTSSGCGSNTFTGTGISSSSSSSPRTNLLAERAHSAQSSCYHTAADHALPIL
jgi:hypothetical protein